MTYELGITAAGIFPFYLGLLAIITRQYQTRYGHLLKLFLLSGITTIPFFSLRALGVDQQLMGSLLGPLYSIIVLAFAEELVKSIALLFDKELKRHHYYPILIGLGFAFFENISYLLGFDMSTSFLIIALVRLFLGSTAHAVFTTLVAHILEKGLHKCKTLYYIGGLTVAGSFHSLFNLLHHWEMSYVTVPLLILLIIYLHFDQIPAHRAASSRSQSKRKSASLAPAHAAGR